MASQIVEELSAFVERKLRKLRLAKLFPGTVKSQDPTSLSVDVQPDDPGELGSGGFSGLALALGLPGFRVKLPAGVKLRQWWDAWDPSRPLAGLFDQDCPVTEVAFDGGTQAVARVDDTVHAGSVLVVQHAGSLAIITFQAFPGTSAGDAAAQAAFSSALGSGHIAFLATLSDGRITSGNTKLKA